jgi:predicted Zn-dependent protease
MRDGAFFSLSDRLSRQLRGDEVLLCNLDGEDSDFVRLNGNRIRQAGGLSAWTLSLDLIQGQRQAQARCDLSGDPDQDLRRAQALLDRLRERLPHVPPDPYLNYATEATESDQRPGNRGLTGDWDSAGAIADLTHAAAGLDLVGIWASGGLHAGFASSLGHRHWHASQNFNLDFSCYLEGGKAVKANLSGLAWDPKALTDKLARVRRDLDILARPARAIPPGRYRAYLAPAAVAEIFDLLAWGGFGLKDHKTAQTPLLRLARGERRLDSRVTLREEHARGLAPGFTAEGFLKPEAVTLIADGRHQDCLVESRSAKEYGQAVNAADEGPESLALDPGDISMADMPYRLGTGLAIGNLWYLNYADRNDCRITGMTRFATFWVENGEPLAPVEVMRFDDSLYHLLGDRLEGLSRERELIVSPETYEGRSSASALLPGILVSGIDLTL